MAEPKRIPILNRWRTFGHNLLISNYFPMIFGTHLPAALVFMPIMSFLPSSKYWWSYDLPYNTQCFSLFLHQNRGKTFASGSSNLNFSLKKFNMNLQKKWKNLSTIHFCVYLHHHLRYIKSFPPRRDFNLYRKM